MALSRREFIKRVSAAAGATMPVWMLAAACADDTGTNGGTATGTTPGSSPGSDATRERRTTLDATIALAAGTGYRALVWGPGEQFAVRGDLGATAGADRAKNRRSILYFGQLSDTHLLDAQTPSRADWTFQLAKVPSANRAQDTLTAQVLAEMVTAVNAVNRSVVTGAPCAVTVITGDLADSHATTEMDWYLRILAGGDLVPNSGKEGEYEGVQIWDECTYAWHPEDPSKDLWGQNGYPAMPGLLTAAVSRTVTSEGLKMPWLSVLGNHDTTWMGTLGPVSPPFDELAVGSAKIAMPPPNVDQILAAAQKPGDPAAEAQLAELIKTLPSQPGVREVTPDAERRAFTRKSIIDAHFTIGDAAGPRGHGFTEASRETGEAWWTYQVGPAVRFIALDSNNTFYGADGSMEQDQWDWLQAELARHSTRYLDASGTVVENNSATDQLIVVLSHHTSWTMDNTQVDPNSPVTLYHGPQVVDLLLRFPNVIAWVNGHTHENRIDAHPATSKLLGGGFWEINTPSCIDWGQQSRMIEIVDNRDGTLSLFTLVVDHAADPAVSKGDFSQANLASISRELSANPWFWDAAAGLGGPDDRNCELVIKAPFDLSKVSDTALEDHALQVSLRELVPGSFL